MHCDLVITNVRKTQRLRHSHCLNIGGQSSQSDVQPLSHGENLLEICGDQLSLDAESPICRYGHTVLPSHGHHGPSVVGHDRLKGSREVRQVHHCPGTLNNQNTPLSAVSSNRSQQNTFFTFQCYKNRPKMNIGGVQRAVNYCTTRVIIF